MIIILISKSKNLRQFSSSFVTGHRHESFVTFSPELNPAEQIWNTLRRNYFANCVFDALDAATTQAEFGLAEMAANKSATRQLTNWPWLVPS